MEVLRGLSKKTLLTHFSPFMCTIRTLQKKQSVKRMRGLPPHLAKTLQQKLEEHTYQDPAIHYKVNIGLPLLVPNKKDLLKERSAHFKKIKEDHELEKMARENKISLRLDEVTRDWAEESAPHHIKAAAEHYGVFQDLFGDAFFYPQVTFDVAFNEKDTPIPVCRGNFIKPSQACAAPDVSYSSDANTLWTLVATNPDGCLLHEDKECLHWLIGNIPGTDIAKGEVVASYVQPFPPRGTGFHRLVFVLYKQDGPVDFSALKIPGGKVDLAQRQFSTYDFYSARQDMLTPAGLAFSQVDWDDSVSRFFHTELDTEEPVFEYDFDPHYYKEQTRFPLKQPFNLYMDRYRDPKQIAKEYLLMKLKNRHPFEKPKPPLRYPNAAPVNHDLNEALHGRIPSWLKREKLKQRMGHGRINDY